MGYRIYLHSATLADSATPGESLPLSLTFINEGFAAPTQYTPIQVVLTHTVSGIQTALDYQGTRDDIRYWLPGEVSLQGSVEIPVFLGDGNYSVAIRFPDRDEGLAGNPAYSIQLANVGMWEEEKGLNHLNHIVSVGTGGAGSLPAAPSTLEASTVSETEITLSWTDGSDNETGFELMRATGEPDIWEPLAIVGPDVESFPDTGARKGKLHSYIIRAVNEFGASDWSDSAQAVTLGVHAAVMQAPTIDLYPNPLNNSNLTIQFPDDSRKQVMISSASGAIVYRTATRQGSLQIDRDLFNPGIYFILLRQHNLSSKVKLVVL
jgi:hypothetical protein